MPKVSQKPNSPLGGIVLRIIKAGSDPQSEKIRSMKGGEVQGIDICPEGFTQSSCQVVPVTNGGYCVEVRTLRSDAFGFDGGPVHEAAAEVGNFADIGTSGCIGLDYFFDQLRSLLPCQLSRVSFDQPPPAA
jgi:hypothetical protein